MIPAVVDPFGPAVTAARDADPVVRRYRAFFALLDWERVPERDPSRPWPGSPPHPVAAYVKTLLVKLCEGKPFVTQLRAFLVEHPLLVLELGFRPALDPARPFGFDPERTVPGARWLRRQQHVLDPSGLAALLAGTVAAVMRACLDLGTTVAVDVKHLYAWVRENNPKEGVPHRFDPAQQPRGDPDCRLGAKSRANRDPVSGRAAPTKEYLWGYGTGIAAATDPRHGDVVLAEWTQAFNHQDITWFHPVYGRAVVALGRRPANLTADAAFAAWHVYQPCAAQGGVVAIPRNGRGHAPRRNQDGHPVCDRALAMAPARRFRHEDGFQAQHYRCPLLWPARTGERGGHAQFTKGPGCTKHVNLEAGGRMRAELDRASAPYRALYRQRTCAERINRQATALGIERLKVRRAAAVHRLATLTYIVINVRALQRMHAAHHAPLSMLC